MRRQTVIAGPASYLLAKEIAKSLDASLTNVSLRTFPDGESKIMINKPIKDTAILVQSTYPPVDTHIIQLFSMIWYLKKHASRVVVVVPYLGYARQDIEFLPNEIVTSAVIMSLLKSLRINKLVIVDVHSRLVLKGLKGKAIDVSATPSLAEFCSKMRWKDPVIVSIDQFWKSHTKEFAKIMNADELIINKIRDRITGKVKIAAAMGEDVKDRDVILFDDMISTGASMEIAAKFLKKEGCRRITAVCTHALLVSDARKRLKNAGVTRIIATNTIPQKESQVDVAQLIADAI